MHTSLRDEFRRVWPLLKEAIIHDTHRKRHVWDAIDKGDCQLWTAPNAAIVTELRVFPTGLKVINGWLAGGELEGVKALVSQAEAWGKSQGCVKAGISCGRAGWSRKLDGYAVAGVQLTKEL